jgi:hypothetical protein
MQALKTIHTKTVKKYFLLFLYFFLISCKSGVIYEDNKELYIELKELEVKNNELYNLFDELNLKFNHCLQIKKDLPLYINLNVIKIDGEIQISTTTIDYLFINKEDFEYISPKYFGGFYYKNDLILVGIESKEELLTQFFTLKRNSFQANLKLGLGRLYSSRVVLEDKIIKFRKEICPD